MKLSKITLRNPLILWLSLFPSRSRTKMPLHRQNCKNSRNICMKINCVNMFQASNFKRVPEWETLCFQDCCTCGSYRQCNVITHWADLTAAVCPVPKFSRAKSTIYDALTKRGKVQMKLVSLILIQGQTDNEKYPRSYVHTYLWPSQTLYRKTFNSKT